MRTGGKKGGSLASYNKFMVNNKTTKYTRNKSMNNNRNMHIYVAALIFCVLISLPNLRKNRGEEQQPAWRLEFWQGHKQGHVSFKRK